jgi:hypothetical protein
LSLALTLSINDNKPSTVMFLAPCQSGNELFRKGKNFTFKFFFEKDGEINSVTRVFRTG